MKTRLTIEPFVRNNSMSVLQEILAQNNIMLVAVGSMACVSSIAYTSEQLKATSKVFLRGLSARDYALGKNGLHIRELLEKALQNPKAKGIIVYCSCLDVITNFAEREILEEITNTQNVPVEFLYRGPLVKRKAPPSSSLIKIWEKWGITPEPIQEKCPIIGKDDGVDFKKALITSNKDESVLIITPGGCVSCLDSLANIDCKKIFYTRFDDLFFSTFKLEQFIDAIEAYFPKDETLLLLGTAVIKLAGISLKEICDALNRDGFSARYIETDGFK